MNLLPPAIINKQDQTDACGHPSSLWETWLEEQRKKAQIDQENRISRDGRQLVVVSGPSLAAPEISQQIVVT